MGHKKISAHEDLQGHYRLFNLSGYETSLRWTILDVRGGGRGKTPYCIVQSGLETVVVPVRKIQEGISMGILRRES